MISPDLKLLEQILPRVQKPIRYMGGEWNSITKDPASIRVRVALGFPDTYEIGMSHLGLKILYSLLNSREGVAAERVFAPWEDFERELRAQQFPLYSLETKTPIRAFDFFGFSIQYELCYTNILTMLDLAGMPLRAQARDLSYPLVLGGGPCTVNPEPIADFFDLFLLGEAEEALPELLERYLTIKAQLPDKSMDSKRLLLRALAEVPGFYAPMLYETARDEKTGLLYVVDPATRAQTTERPPFPIKRRVVADLSQFPFPENPLVPFNEIVHDRVSIEVARGCTEGCRFCQAGTIYRPVRERKASEVVNTVMQSLEKTGYDEVSLASLSFGDYSCATPLVKKLMESLAAKRTALSLPSLRAYALTDEVSEELKKVRRTGLTIAPEGGTQRMRDVINKNITEEDVLKSAATAFANGWSLIKLYFMIGQPTETDEDVAGIVDLAQKVVETGRRVYRGGEGRKNGFKINLSASSFVPKPQTPFQWYAMNSMEELQRKQRLIRSLIKTNQIHFKYHDVRTSQLEGVFSRGDRALSQVVEIAWRKGCRFDGWGECFNYEAWEAAFAEAGVDRQIYLREFPLDAPLPWNHLDSLVKKSFQIKEWQKALAAKVSPPCEKPFLPRVLKEWNMAGKAAQAGMNHIGDKSTFESKAPLVCYNCGMECNLEEIRAERVDNFKTITQALGEPLVPITLASTPALAPAEASISADTTKAAAVYTYRASYIKLEEAKYTSSLDLTRALTRAFLRASIRLKYSQGFHPAPALSFGPALSVGVESLDEYLDFSTHERLTKEDFLARVNPNLPKGLQFKDIIELPSKADSLFKIINGAVYSIPLDTEPIVKVITAFRQQHSDGTMSDVDVHRHLVETFKRREKVIVVREREGKRKELDIIPLIRGLDLIADVTPMRLSMALTLSNGSSVKPEEVIRVIYGIDASHFPVRRERLLYINNNVVLSPLHVSLAHG